ncbi:phage tail family protein [Lacticaseibacillus saniviri]|uniref:phage tail family protein n=1 Tax=Lacticaseibacillus saniviri TaxID=931533 RepID=UPI001EE0A5D2|nr:phage tail family protein [Lacticaseibacillus saniviri]MCG4280861.1 phage tail family protein [Lacticaseibacillus saniviri]
MAETSKSIMDSRYSYGIRYNGHRSNDFGIDVAEKEVGFPAKKKTVVAPLASNTVIDLSELYGPTFSERTIKLVFNIVDRRFWTKESMYLQWTNVVNWLMSSQGKSPLWDDIMQDYHYLAEVQEAPSFEELRQFGRLTVVFQCYPFRIYDIQEFDDIWDTFSFEFGAANKTDYEVNGTYDGILVSLGIANVPLAITVSGPMTITINGETFALTAGKNETTELVVQPGENRFTLSGTGTAHFEWYREVI